MIHRPHRATKIVATLGPASSSPEMIRDLIAGGLDFARINASHGDPESHRQLLDRVREAAAEAGRPVGILFDLQGPKIRLGALSEPREVHAGDTIRLVVGPAEASEFPVDHPHLAKDVVVGDPILIDDGRVSTVTIDVGDGWVDCRVLNDGVLKPRKGINLPASEVTAPSLTEKDRKDALFAVAHKVDLIALSFVRRPEDIQELRQLLDAEGSSIPIVAKIEKPQALENLDGILAECWGVMVARGDLGVELPPEEVPMAQKRIIQRARQECRPVITATQMLESMIRNPRPTRAETSDVANAVLDGTDAVMLSGETAMGRYPTESVHMMDRVIRATERTQGKSPLLRRRERDIDATSDAVADAGCQVAHHLRAKAIVAYTRSGKTAILASKRRPDVPLIAFAASPEVTRQLALVWGVDAYHVVPSLSTDRLVSELDRSMADESLATPGDRVVIIMGGPVWRSGITNLMVVHEVGTWTAPEGDEG